jgi:hypothetical protein
MSSPGQQNPAPDDSHRPVLYSFIHRLIGAISQSPLLKVRLSRTGRLLDCHCLNSVESSLADDVLSAVIEGSKAVSVQLDLRMPEGQAEPHNLAGPLITEPETDDPISSRTLQEHVRIHMSLERMIRDAELVKRETGRHAHWLGYPLLYAAEGDKDILAPVFLWPIDVRIDVRRQGRVYIGRNDAIAPQFNRAMSAWIQLQMQVQLQNLGAAELSEFGLDDIEEELQSIAGRFHPPALVIDCSALLEPIPSPKSLHPKDSPRFYNAAVIGYFRWQNEAILADLETLRGRDACPGVAGDMVRGAELPRPAVACPPDEDDRYLVYDADFSQERVVWQAREHPGLVVHGPPGTGKSQTIVNIIADTLAHNGTVLMVCQKQAATNIVRQRLQAVGLGALFLEVRDAAADRQRVFREIRRQVEQLADHQPNKKETRAELSRQILEKEKLLDEYAGALHGKLPRIGLSYREMKGREGRLSSSFPSLREIPAFTKALEGVAAQDVALLLPRIRSSGELLHRADARHNLWRHRKPTVTPAPALRADVAAALAEL